MSRGVGLDVGGANIKYFVTNTGKAGSLPFPLYAYPDNLSHFLRDSLSEHLPLEWVALTMTGELCDCFSSRAEGVCHIVKSVQTAFANSRVFVYGLPQKLRQSENGDHLEVKNLGHFVSPAEVAGRWAQIAAANWHATGSWLANELNLTSPSLLIDMGSTTTDIIPIWDRQVQATGRTDFERLANAELLYIGMSRTPLQSVLPNFEHPSGTIRLANEWFCSVTDAYLISGEIAECPEDCRTADNQPLTKGNSLKRIARTICTEPEEVGDELLFELARQACHQHQAILGHAIQKVVNRVLANNICPRESFKFVVCGEGDWLLRKLLPELAPESSVVSVSEHFAGDVSRALPAVAVARLFENSAGFQ